MKLKANLHFHTSDDKYDKVEYSLKEGVDLASSLGFGVLALTCHRTFELTQEYADYAKSKEILLIPGSEIDIKEKETDKGRHLLILNCDKDVEKIKTFKDLEEYKKTHPDIFVLAPHPYYYGSFSLKEYLTKYIHLFDGIEQSWFYSKIFNRNKKAEEMAKKYNKPFIATSDTHFLNFLNESYTTINAEEKTIPSVIKALKEGRIENTTSSRNSFTEMFIPQAIFSIKNYIAIWKRHIKKEEHNL